MTHTAFHSIASHLGSVVSSLCIGLLTATMLVIGVADAAANKGLRPSSNRQSGRLVRVTAVIGIRG